MNSTKFVIIWAVTCLAEPTVRERRRVCYEEIGCFDLEPPWFGLTRPLPAPQSPAKIKLRFYFMTRNTMDRPINELKILTTDFYRPTLESLNELDYRSSRIRTAVHVHGMFFSHEWNWPLQKKLAMAYLHKEDVNIIFVSYDANVYRLRNIYFRMVANIRVVGAIAARFFEQLMELTDLKADQIHIVGFSLGAHVAGYIGKRIPNIYRITGLDPAGPFFENADPLYRLAHTDAEHVDVLHMNTSKLLSLGYGPNIGDVDFYFNDNIVQPGCISNHIGKVLRKYFRLYLKKAIRHSTYIYMWKCIFYGDLFSSQSDRLLDGVSGKFALYNVGCRNSGTYTMYEGLPTAPPPSPQSSEEVNEETSTPPSKQYRDSDGNSEDYEDAS